MHFMENLYYVNIEILAAFSTILASTFICLPCLVAYWKPPLSSLRYPQAFQQPFQFQKFALRNTRL